MTINQKIDVILLKSDINTKTDLASKLGISRPTLDVRLDKGTWKKLELKCINELYSKLK